VFERKKGETGQKGRRSVACECGVGEVCVHSPFPVGASLPHLEKRKATKKEGKLVAKLRPKSPTPFAGKTRVFPPRRPPPWPPRTPPTPSPSSESWPRGALSGPQLGAPKFVRRRRRRPCLASPLPALPSSAQLRSPPRPCPPRQPARLPTFRFLLAEKFSAAGGKFRSRSRGRKKKKKKGKTESLSRFFPAP